jgi:electron transfer flavoprotein beta subunit
MKILVAVKRVVDAAVVVRVKSDGTGVDTTNAKMAINPFDAIAVEEAVRLKAAGLAGEVIVVTCGQASAEDVLRTAMAMGADRGILVHSDIPPDALAVAKLLHAVVREEKPSLILAGKQAIDDDGGQVGPMLAALARLPQATCASKLTVAEGSLTVTREIDGGVETLSLGLPAVVTADLRLNEPRYVTLPNIMKAKKKPLARLTPDTLGVALSGDLTTLAVQEPPRRGPGVRLQNARALAEKLRAEIKIAPRPRWSSQSTTIARWRMPRRMPLTRRHAAPTRCTCSWRGGTAAMSRGPQAMSPSYERSCTSTRRISPTACPRTSRRRSSPSRRNTATS